MSERSGYSGGGTRTNPLYGGPSTGGGNIPPGGRTPSWVKKSDSASVRHSAYSDAASSPPDSPPRSASGRSNYGPSAYYPPAYEAPAYTVQTPGHDLHSGSASPYRPPPYYVQTPARSDRDGNGSPESSAPSSPHHSSLGPNSTPFDTRSTRSAKSKFSSRLVPPGSIGKIDEEEAVELAPDPKKDAAQVRARRKKFWKWFLAALCLLLVLLVVAGAITAWFVLDPSEPTYTYNNTTVTTFEVTSGYDANGLPTQQLTYNMTVLWAAKNPNKYFTAYINSGLLQIGFSSIPALSQGGMPDVTIPIGKFSNFSSNATVRQFPLYNAGPVLAAAKLIRFVPLNVKAQFNSHVPMLWKIVSPSYSTTKECVINVDPLAMFVVNTTCT